MNMLRLFRVTFLALLLACLPQFAWATASVLQTGHNETNSSVTTLTLSPTGLTTGSTVVVYVAFNHFFTVSSVVGSVNGSYTATGADADDATISKRVSVWRHANVASGAETITITFSGSTGNVGAAFAELGGVATASFDVAASGRVQTAPGTGTDATASNAATNTAQPALIIAGSYHTGGNAPAAGTGFTSALAADWGATGPGGQMRIESKRITATASQTATFTAATGADTHLNVMAVFDEIANPILSSAPAFSSRTTSSITDVATSSETGTLYGVLVTSGSGAPTCTQIKAGQNSSGTSAYAATNVAATATVSASVAFTSLTSGTVKDGYFCVNGTGTGLDSIVYSLANQYKTPAFSAAPSVTARATTSYTVGETLDGAGTVYLVTCKVPDTAPTIAQIKAGQCTGSVTATSAFNEAVTGADTQALSGLDTTVRPIYNIYIVGTYGSVDSAITTLTSQLLAAPTGQQYVVADVPWGGSANSVFANASPAVADGDVWMAPAVASPSPSNYAITQAADGTFQVATAGDQSRQSFISNVYDVSVDAWYGTFVTYVNNHLPVCTALPPAQNVQTGVAITSVDWNTAFTDADSDALTIAISPSSINTNPLNLALASGIESGAIAAAGTSSLTFRSTDITGEFTDCAAWSISAFDTVTVPTVVGQSFTNAASALSALQLAVPADQQTYKCRRVTAYDQILAQSPAPGVVVNPFTTMHLTVAKACPFLIAPVVQ